MKRNRGSPEQDATTGDLFIGSPDYYYYYYYYSHKTKVKFQRGKSFSAHQCLILIGSAIVPPTMHAILCDYTMSSQISSLKDSLASSSRHTPCHETNSSGLLRVSRVYSDRNMHHEVIFTFYCRSQIILSDETIMIKK